METIKKQFYGLNIEAIRASIKDYAKDNKLIFVSTGVMKQEYPEYSSSWWGTIAEFRLLENPDNINAI